MKTTALSASALLMLTTGLMLGDMNGPTDDGRTVILHDNGTWALAGPLDFPEKTAMLTV